MVCRLILSRSARMIGQSEVDVGKGEIIDALEVAAVVVVGDKGFDSGLRDRRAESSFQQMRLLRGAEADVPGHPCRHRPASEPPHRHHREMGSVATDDDGRSAP